MENGKWKIENRKSASRATIHYPLSTIHSRGFTLLIAVVLSSVAAAVTLALTTLAYKSLVLSSAAQESQFAFYAADAALECLLYNDSSNAPNTPPAKFPFTSTPGDPDIDCATALSIELDGEHTGSGSSLETSYKSDWFPIHGNRCARVTLYKTQTEVRGYAEGTSVACTDLNNPRGIVRAIRAIY